MTDYKLYRFAAVLAVVVYCWSLVHYSLNIPKGDDYLDVLRFLNDYRAQDLWGEKFRLIFSQVNEHRTALAHVLYLVLYESSGEIDFSAVMFVGNFAMLGIAAIFAWQCKESPRWPIAAFIFVFLINFQYWSSAFWAMASIANFWVLFLSFLAISCLFHEGRYTFALAGVAAVLATFSQGNGLVIWPLGVLCLLHRHGFRQGRRQLIAWCLLALAVVAFYFHGFDSTDDSIFRDMERHPGFTRAVVWLLSFLGSGLVFDSQSIPLAVCCGSLVAVITVWSFIYFLKRRPVIAYMIIFLLVSILMVTASRYAKFEPTFALASRYKIYSNCLMVLGLVAVLLRSRDAAFAPALQAGLMAFAAVLCAASYVSGIPALQRDQLGTTDALQRWLLTQNKMHFDFFMRKDAAQQLRAAVEDGVWIPHDVFPDLLVFDRLRAASPCRDQQNSPVIPYTSKRMPGSQVGELQFIDGRLGLDRIDAVVSCKGDRAYIAPVEAMSRRHDGVLVLHYLERDRLESVDALYVRTAAGNYHRAELRSADLPGGG